MARGLRHMISEESDRASFFQLEEGKAKGDLCAVFSFRVDDYTEHRSRLISNVHSKRVRHSKRVTHREAIKLQYYYAQNLTGQAQSSMT